jgi:hypothetical protein
MKQKHFVENKTENMQYILKTQCISLLPKYIKLISRGVFHMHTCTQMQVIKKFMYQHKKQHSSVIKVRWMTQCTYWQSQDFSFQYYTQPSTQLVHRTHPDYTPSNTSQVYNTCNFTSVPPIPIHRFILMHRGHFTFILTKQFALHKANNRYVTHTFLILFQNTFLQTQHELISQL